MSSNGATMYYVCSECGSIDYDSLSWATGVARGYCRKCECMVDLKVEVGRE